jgi:hypothetical protein
MANKILLKKSSTIGKTPVQGDLEYGELAINYTDGKLHYKTSDNDIDTFSSNTATATLANKTLDDVILAGTVTASGSTGSSGEVLTSSGGGVAWTAITSLGFVGGYNNSSATSFPAGDFQGTDAYVGIGGIAFDSFGISLVPSFTCMDPVGSLQYQDLGILT